MGCREREMGGVRGKTPVGEGEKEKRKGSLGK